MLAGTHIGKCMIEMQHSEVEGTARNCLGARTKQPQAPESAGIAQAPEQIRPHPTFSCRSAPDARLWQQPHEPASCQA